MSTDDFSDEKSGSQEAEQESEGVSFALIHKATSLTDFQQLEHPDSIESQVARGRGKATVESVEVQNEGDSDEGKTEYQVNVEEGRIKIDSGYVVRFIQPEHTDLSPFDVMGLDSIKAYPAPEGMIENLTPRIRGYLKEHGYVQVRGAYSPSDSRFYGVQMGWELADEVDPWDRLMEIIDQVSTTPAAVDYMFIKEGPDRWDVEEVSKVRGIASESVRNNVRAIENELDQ